MIQSILKRCCGLFSYLRLIRIIGAFRKNRILVLMYHGVTGYDHNSAIRDVDSYNLPITAFERQMDYLLEYCNVIPVSDAISANFKNNGQKNIVITFDDGYRNFFTYAFPILSRYRFPALMSLPTSFVIGKHPLWNDAFEYAVIRTTKKKIDVKWNGNHRSFRLDSELEKRALLLWLYTKSNHIHQEKRFDFIKYIFNVLEVRYASDEILQDTDYEPLHQEEITYLAQSGLIEFASHTVDHFSLTNVQPATLDHQLKSSKHEIERITDQPCRYLCIPGGSYSDTTIKRALLSGYEKVFSSERVEYCDDHLPDVIGRYSVRRYQTESMFEDMIHGCFHTAYYNLAPKMGLE